MNSLLNKKRRKSRQKSVEQANPKNKKKLTLAKAPKEVKQNFMAKLKEYTKFEMNRISKGENKIINKKLTGDDIVFEYRKNKAKNIFEEIEQLINDSKNIEIIKEKINQALSYDNISKENIYKSLIYCLKIGDKDGYNNIMNKAKYALTKKFSMIDKNNNNTNINIDLNQELKLSDDIIMFEDEDNLIDEFKNAIDNLEIIYEEINNFKMENLPNSKILKSKIVLYENNLYTIEKKSSENETLQKIYDNIHDFLIYYLFVDNFQYYGENQPIDYNNNSVIYIINLFYRLFSNTTKLSKWGEAKYVSVDEDKMEKIFFLKKYKEHIFDLLENNNNKINSDIEEKLELYFFYLESDKSPDSLEDIIEKSIQKNTPLNSEKIQKFIENNKNKTKNFYEKNNSLYLEFKGKTYDFKYKDYNEKLLGFLENNNDIELIEQGLWNPILMINYFDEDDISFMKGLLKQILNSKLFKEIYKKYSNVDKDVEYYFKEERNIDDLLRRIKFFPFEEINTGRQASTIPKELKIITSSKYVSKIGSRKDFVNFKILEIGRKLIIIIHEITHFIKRALNLITNGKVLASTIENDNEDPNIIECGRFFEYIVFNWENPYIIQRAKSLKKIKKYEEEEEFSKILNIKKALKLLDPSIYNKSINDFKKYFYDQEEKKEEDMNEELKEYLKKINFNITDYFLNKNSYKRYKINCSRKALSPYYIEYISDNHNFPYRFNRIKLPFQTIKFI